MAIAGPTTDHHEIRHWAQTHHAVATEILPAIVDSEPVQLRIMLEATVRDHPDVRVLAREEFFAKFDALGLSFVYDNDHTGYNELLQVEAKSPYRNPKYGAVSAQN